MVRGIDEQRGPASPGYRMPRRILSASLALTILLLCAPAMAATLSASVDRKTLYQDEFVVFKLSLLNSETRLRAEGESPNVDLTLLSADFELGTPQAAHNYNVFRNRGRSTSSITVTLFPRRSGALTIPPFSVDGLRSEAITLQVMPAKADKTPPVFARSGTTQASVWTGEPTLAYLDLYHRVTLKDARLGGKIETTPLQVRLSKLPQTESKVSIDGMRYSVTRSLWSIAPLDDRPVTIDFPDIWVETANGDKIRLPFTSAILESRPLPEGVPPGILMGTPTLTQRFDAEAFRQNEPIPWEITLTAPVDIAQLPDNLPISGNAPRLKIYMEKATRQMGDLQEADKPVSTAIYHGFLIPLDSGEITTPDIRLPYFDTGQGFVTILELKGEVLTVKETVTATEQAPVFISGPALAPDRAPGSTGEIRLWQAASAVLVVLWAATLGVVWWRGRAARPRAATREPRKRTPGAHAPPLIAMLLEALRANTLEQGLERWEARHGKDEELRHVIARLQRLYYSAGKKERADDLRQQVVDLIRRIQAAPPRRDGAAETDPWSPLTFQRRPGN